MRGPLFSSFHLLPAVLVFSLAACGDDDEPSDGGVLMDASSGDAGVADATSADARADAGRADATPDAGRPDSADPRSIIFLHTNDEHSHQLGFGPEVDDFPTPAPSGSGLVGGLKRRAKVLEDLRGEASRAPYFSPVALVSSGDQMMGSLFHLANPSQGIDYAIAGLLGYDAMTLGNHEFDFGVGALVGALSNGGITASGIGGIVQVPVLTSNIRFSMTNGDDALQALYSTRGNNTHPLRRLYVKQFGEVRVGFLGLLGLDASFVAPLKTPVRFSLTATTTACTQDVDCPDSICLPPATDPLATSGRCAANVSESDAATHFPALVADAAATVAELRAEGVDLVVVLAHVGVNEREVNSIQTMGLGWETARASEEIVLARGVDQALAAAGIPGINVIIGGHSHTALPAPLAIPNPNSGITTFIVQAGSYGRAVGKLRLTQADPSAPWALDATYSGLVPVDDTVDASTLSQFTAQLIDGAMAQVIDGLESLDAASAGDGIIFPGEQCDGAELPNQGNCVGLVTGATGGQLACFANRQLDLSGCTFASGSCGNATAEGIESCDSNDLRGANCASLGYTGGALSCAANCTLVTSACAPHFPSLLEIVVNFAETGVPIADDPGDTGDLFFYSMGTTTFDLPGPRPSLESNLINLVTDAERWTPNQLVPALADDPIRIALSANGIIRDGIFEGRTGALTVEDLFRVLPLGVSPLETTPGYTVIDFWLRPEEVLAGIEIGVGSGIDADDFWLGASGVRVEYDLSRPPFSATDPTSGRVTKITLTTSTADPWDDSDTALEATPLFDRSLGNPFPQPNRLVHVSTSFYIGLFMESLGICMRDDIGAQMLQCRSCTSNTQCTAAGSTCNMTLGRCTGGYPAAIYARTLMPVTSQEIKEFLALTTYIRRLPNASLPSQYNAAVPRRFCCVGTACPADQSRTCN